MVSSTVVPIRFSRDAAEAAAASAAAASSLLGSNSMFITPCPNRAAELAMMADDNVAHLLPNSQARESKVGLLHPLSPASQPAALHVSHHHPLYSSASPSTLSLASLQRTSTVTSSVMGLIHTPPNSPSFIAQQHCEDVEPRERKSTQLFVAACQLRANSASNGHGMPPDEGGRTRATASKQQDQLTMLDFGLDLDGYGYHNEGFKDTESHDDKTDGANVNSKDAGASSINSAVFSHFSSHLHLFSYLLLLAGLRQNTSRFYRNWLRVVTYGCLVMCFINLFLRTKSYRNPLFDVTLVLLHILVSLSYEWWLRYCRSREWRTLMGIVTKVSSAHFAQHVRLLGWFGLIMVSGATITIVLGWEVPIFGAVAQQLQDGSGIEHLGKFVFLILHGVFMIVIIAPWAAVCMTSVCLFKLVVLAHQSDLEHHFLFIKHSFTKSLEQIISEQTSGAIGISITRRPTNQTQTKTGTANPSDLATLTEMRSVHNARDKKDVIADCFRFFVKHHQACRHRLRATCHYFNWLYLGYLVLCGLLVFSAAMDLNHYVTLFPFPSDVFSDSVAYSLFPHLVQDIFYMGLGFAGIYCSFYVTADLTSSFQRFNRRINDLPIAFPNAAFAYVSIPPATLAGLIQYYETSATAYTLFDTPITSNVFTAVMLSGAAILFFNFWLVNT